MLELTIQSSVIEGVPVDEAEITGGEYDRVVCERSTDDEQTLVVTGEQLDEESGQVRQLRTEFEITDKALRGIRASDYDRRRDVPEDIQDVLAELGFAVIGGAGG